MLTRAQRLVAIQRKLAILDGLLAIADKLNAHRWRRVELARERDDLRRKMGASERREYERLTGEQP